MIKSTIKFNGTVEIDEKMFGRGIKVKVPIIISYLRFTLKFYMHA